jgi:hypothetical protein
MGQRHSGLGALSRPLDPREPLARRGSTGSTGRKALTELRNHSFREAQPTSGAGTNPWGPTE